VEVSAAVAVVAFVAVVFARPAFAAQVAGVDGLVVLPAVGPVHVAVAGFVAFPARVVLLVLNYFSAGARFEQVLAARLVVGVRFFVDFAEAACFADCRQVGYLSADFLFCLGFFDLCFVLYLSCGGCFFPGYEGLSALPHQQIQAPLL
jgi:hypothetical protein